MRVKVRVRGGFPLWASFEVYDGEVRIYDITTLRGGDAGFLKLTPAELDVIREACTGWLCTERY